MIESGEGIWIVPTLEGSEENLSVTLENRDPATGATGKVTLSDTRGYSDIQEISGRIAAAKAAFRETFVTKFAGEYAESELDRMIDEATRDAEAEILRQTGPYAGAFTPGITNALASDTEIRFTPPRNFTSGILSYQIRIFSNESNAASITLNISVKNETDRVPEAFESYNLALTNLDTRITAEVEQRRREQEAQELQERLNNPVISIYQDTENGSELLFRTNRDNITSVSFADDELEFTVEEAAGAREYVASGYDTRIYGTFDIGGGEYDLFGPVYLDEFDESMLDNN